MKKDDAILPKSICLDCWIKTKYFHEFYNTVATNKIAYLANVVKNDEPNFIEVKCDSSEYDYNIPSVKVEPIIDEDTNSMKHYGDNRFDIEHATQPSHDPVANESSDQLNCMEIDNNFDNDNNDEDECEGNDCDEFIPEYDPIINSNLSSNAAAELARNIYEKKYSATTDEFVQLLPNYCDMICELCKHEFKTLNQAIVHYRFTHGNAKVHVKCCQKRISSLDLREHILYHMNPDLYR